MHVCMGEQDALYSGLALLLNAEITACAAQHGSDDNQGFGILGIYQLRYTPSPRKTIVRN